MDYDLLNWLKRFDFVDYFDITVHSMEFKNTQWKKDEIMKELNEGFCTIKCSTCDKNSQWINTKNKTCYCEEHIKMYDCSDDNMHKVVRIVSDFKVKLEKMEKYLIYIQERYNYFTDPNSDDKLLPENIIELENIKESLDRKIDAFLKIITNQKESRKLQFYDEVKESYEPIKDTVFIISKMISDLLHELKTDSLFKIINEDLAIVHRKNEEFEEEKKEEPKEDIKEEQKEKKDFFKPQDIFDKKVNIMVADYLSAKKINQLQDNIQKVCNWMDDYYLRFKENEEVKNHISLVRLASLPQIYNPNIIS